METRIKFVLGKFRLGKATAAAMALMSGIASATETDVSAGYVGTRFGISNDNIDTRGSGVIGEVFAGFNINARWAIELSGFGAHTDVDLSEFSNEFGLTGDKVSVHGASISARYAVPLGANWRVYGRGGLTHLDLKERLLARVGVIDPDTPVAGEETRPIVTEGDSIGAVIALGVDTALGRRWRVGAELQYHQGDLRVGPRLQDGQYLGFGFNRSGSLRVAMLTLTTDF